ncbi:DUF6596 domain-containing protein, partial [Nocardia cyriacigeorgica]|uniref:DUF6596 domain-containing protein n=1 Tax=Nocardia cyriacigeorgica TaxID=135487 RepID=UPI00313D7A6F
MHGGDPGLDLIWTGRSAVPDAIDESRSLRDHFAIPLRGILLIEGYQFTGLGARRAGRLGGEQKRGPGPRPLRLPTHARRPPRTEAGELVPLDQQDPAQWNREMIAEGTA